MFQVLSKEREIQRTKEINEDISSRIHDVSEKLRAISVKFKEKSPDVDHAKEEVKVGFQFTQLHFQTTMVWHHLGLMYVVKLKNDGVVIILLRACLRTWKDVVVFSLNWILLCKILGAGAPFWPSS